MNEQPSFFDNPKVIHGTYNGLPYEGPPIYLKDEDAPVRRPRMQATAKARVFHFDNENDRLEYNNIIQLMADGRNMKSVEDIRYNEARGSFDVFLRWLEMKYIAPEEQQNV